MIKQEILVALGANLPTGTAAPRETLHAAISQLSGEYVSILRISRFFETDCFPAGSGPDYVNACVAISSALSPSAILHRLNAIEAAFDRQRTARWGSRTLDLDLLAMGDSILPDPQTERAWRELAPERRLSEQPRELILPHPRLAERAFVLGPLNDVAPGWRHPATGRSVAEMFAALSPEDHATLRPL